MDEPYLCPVCRDNRHDFLQILKLAREIRKDPETGAVVFADDEWETLARNGRLELDIRCRLCGHTAPEADFIRTAQRDAARFLVPRGRRA